MYILVEFIHDSCDELAIKGLFRQIKAASLQAWKLFFQDRLDMIDDYCDESKQNPVPRQYGILCWDERSEENLLLGIWRLHSPPLERNKVRETQKQDMTQSIQATLVELEHGAVPHVLWNKFMSFSSAAKKEIRA